MCCCLCVKPKRKKPPHSVKLNLETNDRLVKSTTITDSTYLAYHCVLTKLNTNRGERKLLNILRHGDGQLNEPMWYTTNHFGKDDTD
ncbi:hypothetical protein D5086_020051 [Populus alba]|uniref:Uncharacterized protein n=1 Tax=Populus alba TaxID=43335 RepID=A0ACC4BIY9_POPAL